MVTLRDKKELIKLMDKHDLNLGNREDELRKSFDGQSFFG